MSAKRLLVLGTSGSAGVGLDNPEVDAWPQQVRAALAERFGPVELVHRRFFAQAPGALAFLDEQLLAAQPVDWVVLQATAHQVTQLRATNRIARRFGRRAGGFVDGASNRVFHVVGSHGRVGRALWWSTIVAARKTIGVESVADYRSLTDTYVAAIGRIARLESADAVAIGTGQPRGFVARTNPETGRIVQRFNGELSAAAERHKIPWIDQDAASWHGEEFETRFVDLFHKVLGWHHAIAAEVLAVFDPVASRA